MSATSFEVDYVVLFVDLKTTDTALYILVSNSVPGSCLDIRMRYLLATLYCLSSLREALHLPSDSPISTTKRWLSVPIAMRSYR